MKPKIFITLTILVFTFFSCSTQRYIHDSSSHKRQKELKVSRSGNVIGDVLLTLGSVIFSTAAEVDAVYVPAGQEFKRIKLVNPTTDTMFVNMLTDATWDNENYCDFMDIRIPPLKKCKLLVPVGIDYNIYFGNSSNPEKDEFFTVNTIDLRKIDLFPGVTNIDEDIIISEQDSTLPGAN